ncbi:MAG TPA: hypothetical protein VF169_02230 [Albitalea sp.]|uniref:hypothetical protein n=1 Tax=Piscinibacter sp. TaxID=1903157 RepID=UPI002ED45C3E
MKAIHLLGACVLLASAAAHAGEISEFPISDMSVASRDAVRAQAVAANDARQLRYDTVGPVVAPMSSRSREEVRREAAVRNVFRDLRTLDHAGGM